MISGKDSDNPILLFTNKIEGKLLVYVGTDVLYIFIFIVVFIPVIIYKHINILINYI